MPELRDGIQGNPRRCPSPTGYRDKVQIEGVERAGEVG